MLDPEVADGCASTLLGIQLPPGWSRGSGGVYEQVFGCHHPVSLLLIGALPGPVLRAERGGPPGLSWDLRQSPPGPERCHRCRWAGTQTPVSVAAVCPAPAGGTSAPVL